MNRWIIYLGLAILSTLIACDCEPFYLVDGSTFAFRITDANTSEDVFLNRFDPSNFQIIDDHSDTVNIDEQRPRRGSRNSFFLDPTGGESFRYDQRFRQTYYLVFDSLDTDTLELFFVPRQDDCEEHMDDFEAYYNNELILEGSGNNSYDAKAINKP